MSRHSRISLLLITIVDASLVGCSTSIPDLKEWSDPIIGHPISIIAENDKHPGSYASRIRWMEKCPLDNGHWVHVHPDRIGCEIHFEVGIDGNVVGYQPVGEGCSDQGLARCVVITGNHRTGTGGAGISPAPHGKKCLFT